MPAILLGCSSAGYPAFVPQLRGTSALLFAHGAPAFGYCRSPNTGVDAPMALNATIHSFEITLNDADRGVYQALSFRAARHPSETAEFLVARVLAYCLEYGEGISFSKGLSDPDAPALGVRDLTGSLLAWIDIGIPDTTRLHRAAKAAPRVVVYSHKEVAPLMTRLAADRVHRAREIEIYTLDRELVGALAARLAKRMSFDLAVSERSLYLTFDDATLSGAVTPHRLETPA
jgi:uncharacterized protein YaeQ